MMIKDFGGRVASVWEGLRPITKKMLVRALESSTSTPTNSQGPRVYYDAHADWELSRLLSALDEQSKAADVRSDSTKLSEIEQLATTCARVLENQTASAEVFILLAERALKENDYNHVDKLADLLTERFSAGEVAEIIRQTDMPQIRALAFEAMAMMPISSISPLLDDPLYSGIAASSLEQKAFEFDSEEARDVLDLFDADNGFPGD